MSAEVIATLAVGVPVGLIAVVTYFASRSEGQDKRVRQLFADLIAPFDERIKDLEDRRDRHS